MNLTRTPFGYGGKAVLGQKKKKRPSYSSSSSQYPSAPSSPSTDKIGHPPSVPTSSTPQVTKKIYTRPQSAKLNRRRGTAHSSTPVLNYKYHRTFSSANMTITSNANNANRRFTNSNPCSQKGTPQDEQVHRLRQELRAVHRILTCVPSPRRRVVKAGARAVAAATAAAKNHSFGRTTLDLYAGIGLEEAQTTTQKISTKLSNAISNETNATMLQKLSHQAIGELVKRCITINGNHGNGQNNNNIYNNDNNNTKENKVPTTTTTTTTTTTSSSSSSSSQVMEHILPLVRVVMQLKQTIENEKSMNRNLEKAVQQAEQKTKVALEKAELMKLTMDTHLNNVIGSSNRKKRKENHVTVLPPPPTRPSLTGIEDGSSRLLSDDDHEKTVCQDMGQQTNTVLIFDEVMKRNYKQQWSMDYEATIKQLKLQKKTAETTCNLLQKTKADNAQQIKKLQHALAAAGPPTCKQCQTNELFKTTSQQKIDSLKTSIQMKNQTMDGHAVQVNALKRKINGLEKEKQLHLKNIKQIEKENLANKATNKAELILKKNLIHAESMNNRLSNELEAERIQTRTLTLSLEQMKTTTVEQLQTIKKNRQEMYALSNQMNQNQQQVQQDVFDEERKSRLLKQGKQEEKQIATLEATLESERRLVLLNNTKHEQIQERLKKDMQLEVQKGFELQEGKSTK